MIKKNICIIPARGGSKRIPKKNIRNFFGKPIVVYSIEAALESGLFDEVMVSTDSQEIAEIAIKNKAKVPFLRSIKNSNDFASTADVVEEVLLEYKKVDREFKYVCCLYPTAPFVTSSRLKESVELLENSDVESVIPITSFNYPIQRSFKINNDGKVAMFYPENINIRSQDLPPAYHDCGQFYCLNVDNFLINKKIYTEDALPMIIPEYEVQDIDNEEDWQMAELKYKLLHKIT